MRHKFRAIFIKIAFNDVCTRSEINCLINEKSPGGMLRNSICSPCAGTRCTQTVPFPSLCPAWWDSTALLCWSGIKEYAENSSNGMRRREGRKMTTPWLNQSINQLTTLRIDRFHPSRNNRAITDLHFRVGPSRNFHHHVINSFSGSFNSEP